MDPDAINKEERVECLQLMMRTMKKPSSSIILLYPSRTAGELDLIAMYVGALGDNAVLISTTANFVFTCARGP
ncbi:hypothetical protein PILCRDRAFT_731450 [Piloderma croceum F 1598]|uniref:Uncharacterized protein n=1 Tax=Piloderma croceum (strain F 1598) TaxID=765440 RepID=A0A0C3B7F8_PILCF|nr:hypothetical protein PILCRDRAFT_731450 [Piloderma croceum F 1598]